MAKMIYATNSLGLLTHTYEDKDGKTFLAGGETYKAPLKAGDNQVAVLNHQSDTWSLVTDHRGSVYYTEDGVEVTITQIGVEPPSDAIFDKPANKYYDTYDRVNNEWKFNFNECRNDLIDLVEMQEQINQVDGVIIDNDVWDTDASAHLRFTQILTTIHGHRLYNIENNAKNPFPPVECFQQRRDVYVTLTESMAEVWWKANEHQLRQLFIWSKVTRDTIMETTNPETLMKLFDSIKFDKWKYDAMGRPIEG